MLRQCMRPGIDGSSGPDTEKPKLSILVATDGALAAMEEQQQQPLQVHLILHYDLPRKKVCPCGYERYNDSHPISRWQRAWHKVLAVCMCLNTYAERLTMAMRAASCMLSRIRGAQTASLDAAESC